jgi:hypothetical protein
MIADNLELGSNALKFETSTENLVDLRKRIFQERVEFIEKRLRENFPTTYSIFHSFLLVFFGLIGFVLQIFMIVNKESNYVYGQGIWAGIACITLGISVLLLGN